MTDFAPITDEPDEPPELSDDELQELAEPDAEVAPVSYSGTDFDAEGLVRRLQRKDIVVPNFGHDDDTMELAGFQRGFVWRKSQMDRFIESLLLGFPIPGIMLVEQADKRYLVLDGQQRLKTLEAFYEGVHRGKVFELEYVADDFRGLTYKSLSPAQKRTIDNTFIQATIVKNSGTRESLDSIYQVFERLNSGGTQLTAHEIRIALYPGPFVRFLAELNTLSGWREIYGPTSLRLRDQELVLRILALFDRAEYYERPLKKFLNDYLGDNRYLESYDTDRIQATFMMATIELARADARNFLRRSGQRVNAALLEAVVVAVMLRVHRGEEVTTERIREGLETVIADKTLMAATAVNTSAEDNVATRLTHAEAAFTA